MHVVHGRVAFNALFSCNATRGLKLIRSVAMQNAEALCT
jgi:hypothetical protein